MRRRPGAHLRRGRGGAAHDRPMWRDDRALRVARRAARHRARTRSCPARCRRRTRRCTWRARKHDTVALAAEYGVGALVLGFSRARRGRRDAHASTTSTIATRTRRALRLDGRQRPLLGAVPDDRARRRRPRRSRSARAGSASSPRRSRTGTAAGRRRRRGRRRDDNVAEIGQPRATRWSPGCTRPTSRSRPTHDQRLQRRPRLRHRATRRSSTSSGSIDAGADEIMCLIQMGTVPAGGLHGDHPPVGREGHPALPVATRSR